jgi:alpha-beta hydrolase superfamily lysophospholipase
VTRRTVRALLATATTVLLVGMGVAAAVASDGVTPVAGRPGELLDAVEIPAPGGARAWRVRYVSEGVRGTGVAVSGTVIAPDGPAPRGGRPVVAWAHATTGTADACAPSAEAAPLAGIVWLDDLLAAGYVVAATDYEGLGTEGDHPYLVGASEGRSVLDSIRAARQLPVDANRRAVVYGHSQGGHAALFAGELARTYAPDLSVRGVAPGAPVASPGGFLDDAVRDFDTAGFLVMTAIGYRAAYPEVAAAPWMPTASAQQVDVAEAGCGSEVVQEFTGVDPTMVFGVDPDAVPGWEAGLRANTPGRRASVPVLLWQGRSDELTRPEWVDAFARRACRRGTVLDVRLYPGADHATVRETARGDVLAFVAARLAGERPTSTCPARAGRRG